MPLVTRLGNEVNDDGDGATGNEVDDDGDSATGDDDNDDDDGDGNGAMGSGCYENRVLWYLLTVLTYQSHVTSL